jgi:segregation and condensation protein B
VEPVTPEEAAAPVVPEIPESATEEEGVAPETALEPAMAEQGVAPEIPESATEEEGVAPEQNAVPVVLEQNAAPELVPETAPESVVVPEVAVTPVAVPEEMPEQNAAVVAVSETVPVTPVLQAALIEAILYLESNPVDEEWLARVSRLPMEAVRAALLELEDKYAQKESGVELSRLGGGVMLSPKWEYWELLKERYGKKNESRLSRAAMETLSIIAYSQPITRSEVEAIRGVQADNMIRLLLDKELIREVGKKNAPGKPVQFGTTKAFLKLFRMKSIADLPKLNESEADRFELQS